MLKWALNKRIEPMAPVTAVLETGRQHKRRSMGQPLRSAAAATAHDHQSRRKSVATAEYTRRYRNRHNKENIIIASPHPVSMRAGVQTTSTPYAHQATALRDVGNTTPTRKSLNAALNTTPLRKRHLPLSPLFSRAPPMAGSPSAGTAPLVIEPRAVRTPPTIADRVPNTYFGHPLYFPADPQANAAAVARKPQALTRIADQTTSAGLTPLSRRLAELRFSKVSIQRHQIFNNQHCDDEEDANMSSKALNDTALNEMIDEILYSTRKVRPLVTRPFVPVPPAPQVTPNSTLLELTAASAAPAPAAAAAAVAEQTAPEQTVLADDESMDVGDQTVCFQLDVRSPEPEVCQLRRQGGLRRKRTHKSAEPAAKMDALMASHPYLRQSIDILASLETPPKKMRWF